ncbi:MAG: hypothetical protein KDB37_19140 [Ilumatobacter sp.]|nr:hypothetical protein [Ilumatobacter sp.]
MRFTELVASIRERPGPVRIVAIDGPGGSGKSTFAALLAAALGGAPVVPTDDFASWDQPLDWRPRMLDQVIEPLARGERGRYQRYDWPTSQLAEWIDVQREPVVIIEGVTSARSEWRRHLAYVVWIDTPHDERLRRGLERDGPDALDDWQQWGAAEDAHYTADPTRDLADVIVDGQVPPADGGFATVDR